MSSQGNTRHQVKKVKLKISGLGGVIHVLGHFSSKRKKDPTTLFERAKSDKRLISGKCRNPRKLRKIDFLDIQTDKI